MKKTIIRGILLTALVLLGATSLQAAGTDGETGSGTVLQTIDAKNYTYLQLREDGQEVWVAVPATKVEVGAQVSYRRGMVMNDFHSTTLDRTFDKVIFSAGLTQGAVQPAAEEGSSGSAFDEAVKQESSRQPGKEIAPSENSPGSAGATVPYVEAEVARAEGDNGHTVAEIFAKAGELAGQKVRVRGKVVKFSPAIMGRNWIHLQDGSGDPMQNTHDLVVTSNESAEVGEVVTAEGTLAAKKDFGYGYSYEALIEEATLSR